MASNYNNAARFYDRLSRVVYGKSLIPSIIRSVRELKYLILDMQKESKDIRGIVVLLRCVSEMEGKLEEFAGQFGIEV